MKTKYLGCRMFVFPRTCLSQNVLVHAVWQMQIDVEFSAFSALRKEIP